MDLDDHISFTKLDPRNMLAEIDDLPMQLESAWKLGRSLPLPKMGGIHQVIISGMGGSAIGADMVIAAIAGTCPVPVIVHRDYGLPAWAHGARTLLICSSHSGNTEETLDSFEAGRRSNCRLLAVCTGGELEARAKAAGVPVWKFEHTGQPRAAVGYSFGLLLSIINRLGLVPHPEVELLEAAESMRSQQKMLGAVVPVAGNPAKRMAGQLVGRWVNVYGAGHLAPVARRWKGQVNELAKAGAGFEVLPESDHNALAGLVNPEILARTITLFLQALSDPPRTRLRFELTIQAFLTAGLNTDVHVAQGNSTMAQMWTALHFGDYLAYYLAMAYGMDPTPVEALEDFKVAMKSGK